MGVSEALYIPAALLADRRLPHGTLAQFRHRHPHDGPLSGTGTRRIRSHNRREPLLAGDLPLVRYHRHRLRPRTDSLPAGKEPRTGSGCRDRPATGTHPLPEGFHAAPHEHLVLGHPLLLRLRLAAGLGHEKLAADALRREPPGCRCRPRARSPRSRSPSRPSWA